MKKEKIASQIMF